MSFARLPAGLKKLLALSIVSCLGSGLTLPFLLVYLHQIRHISLATTGLLLAIPAVVGLVATPSCGQAIDAVGSRAVLVLTSVIAGGSSAAISIVHSPTEAIAPLVGFGIGMTGIMTSVNTLIAQLATEPADQVRAFSIEFTFVNIGIGAGAFISGLFVSTRHPASFELIYLLDAASFLVAGVGSSLVKLPDVRPGRRHERLAGGAHAPVAPSYRMVLGDKNLLRYMLLTFLIGLCGYGSLDAAAVGFSTTVVGVRAAVVAYMFALNTLVIVSFQHFVTKRVERIRRSRAMASTGALFGLSWLVLLSSSAFAHRLFGEVLVICFGGVFAIGEMLQSPVRNVIVNALASEQLRGRYNAASFFAFQLSNVVAPATIGVLLGASLGRELLVGISCISALSAWYAIVIGQHLSDEADNRWRAAAEEPA